MIQQILLQKYTYTRKRSYSLDDNRLLDKIFWTMRGTLTSQKKLNKRQTWTLRGKKLAIREMIEEKRNWNSPEISTPHKQPQMNRFCQPSKLVPIILTLSRDLRRSSMTRAPTLEGKDSEDSKSPTHFCC
jgi:hypothetical protein